MDGPKAFLMAIAIITVVILAAMAEETDQHKRAPDAEAKKINKRLPDRRGMQPLITSRKLSEDPCGGFYCDGDASCDYLLGLDCDCYLSRFSCFYSSGFKPEYKCEDFECDNNDKCDHVPKLTCGCNVDSGECKS